MQQRLLTKSTCTQEGISFGSLLLQKFYWPFVFQPLVCVYKARQSSSLTEAPVACESQISARYACCRTRHRPAGSAPSLSSSPSPAEPRRDKPTPWGINQLEFARGEGFLQLHAFRAGRHPDTPKNVPSRRTGRKGEGTAHGRVLCSFLFTFKLSQQRATRAELPEQSYLWENI